MYDNTEFRAAKIAELQAAISKHGSILYIEDIRQFHNNDLIISVGTDNLAYMKSREYVPFSELSSVTIIKLLHGIEIYFSSQDVTIQVGDTVRLKSDFSYMGKITKLKTVKGRTFVWIDNQMSGFTLKHWEKV